MRKIHLMLLSSLVLALTGAIVAHADDYEAFASGLQQSSKEVNKLNIPDLIYKLDQPTAEKYFGQYFEKERMTHSLQANIGYPIFHWGNNHENLQKGICPVLIDQIQKFFAGHNSPAAISKACSDDNTLHDHIFYSLIFLVDIANSKTLDTTYKAQIGNAMFKALELSNLAGATARTIDHERYPYANSVKAQLLMTCFTFCKVFNDISPLIKTVSQDPTRQQLLTKQNVLVLDNGFFDAKQLQCIQTFVDSIPAHARIPFAVTCFDKLISKQNKLVTVHNFRCNGSFNVFPCRVGASSENQFPGDFRAVQTDVFSIVLAHEFNHNVDSIYVASNEQLKAYKEKLLAKAGKAKENYLRSMCGDGFFANSPQEFIASLSNQYFCDSNAMLEYALQKAGQGNLNHINQFILMASIYSDDKTCCFYTTSTQGVIKQLRTQVVKKDCLITDLQSGTKKYRFDYTDGVITKIF